MKKKLCVAAIIVFAIIVAILAFELLPFAVNVNPFDSYGCISIAFDKYEMKRANRLVLKQLQAGSVTSTTECTDQKLIDNLVKETMVATKSAGCHSDKILIEVYSDDTLIRTMTYSDDHDTIKVYQADDKHYIWGGSNDGYVWPTQELVLLIKHAFVTG